MNDSVNFSSPEAGNFFGVYLLPLFGAALVILLAYFFTKWLSKKSRAFSSGKHIRIVERAALGQDKQLVLTEVNGTVYFLGVAGQGIETISSFDAKELAEEDQQQPAFKNILGDLLKKSRHFAPVCERYGENNEEQR